MSDKREFFQGYSPIVNIVLDMNSDIYYGKIRDFGIIRHAINYGIKKKRKTARGLKSLSCF